MCDGWFDLSESICDNTFTIVNTLSVKLHIIAHAACYFYFCVMFCMLKGLFRKNVFHMIYIFYLFSGTWSDLLFVCLYIFLFLSSKEPYRIFVITLPLSSLSYGHCQNCYRMLTSASLKLQSWMETNFARKFLSWTSSDDVILVLICFASLLLQPVKSHNWLIGLSSKLFVQFYCQIQLCNLSCEVKLYCNMYGNSTRFVSHNIMYSLWY